MRYLTLGNPMWSGQIVMLGGPRRVIWTTSFYAMILCVGCALGVKFREFGAPPQAAARILQFLSFIQIFVLYVMGSSARLKAMQRDHQSRMLESIRISPMRAWTVIVGYMFGPAAQPIINWFIGVIVGFGLIIAYNLGGPRDWVIGNLLLLVAVQTAWAFQVFLGVGLKKAANQAIFAYVGCFFIARSVATLFVVGTSLFLGLQPAMLSMEIMLGGDSVDKEFSTAILASVIMTLFWGHAAAKRFRRPDLPALGVASSMCLCILWASCMVMGNTQALLNLVLVGMPFGADGIPAAIMYICGSLLIFAAIPISSAAQVFRIGILRSNTPLKRTRSAIVPIFIASLSVSVAALALVMDKNVLEDPRFIDSALIMAATGLMFCGVIRLSCFRWRGPTTAWTLMAAFWLLPVLVSGVWRGIQLTRELVSEH
ncbi:MAG: hypothetical protein GXP29_09415, partial [Planctomycetes bacterium]|nr:hypothetical protein [Planctomycetota bacterium]